MNAIILSIGDELVLGQTVDTNSAWLAAELVALGVFTLYHQTVADDRPAIARAIAQAAELADLVLISGGLGPTEDDLTREALADALSAELVLHEPSVEAIRAMFGRRGREMPERNKVQALHPAGSDVIPNTCGTAPGLRARLGRATIFVTPGVPGEMFAMWRCDLRPAIARMLDEEAAASGVGRGVILTTKVNTLGLGESTVAEKLGELMTRGRNPTVGTTVSGGVVAVRVRSEFADAARARVELERTAALARERLGAAVFGRDDESLQAAVVALLIERRVTVATAESCTGGLLGKMFTDVPGSSAAYLGGWVAYSNTMKTRELGVSGAMLEKHGAVSQPVARAMAAGALEKSGATTALAITGTAGPDGGTAEKPVGTVWIALATRAAGSSEAVTDALRLDLSGDRGTIRDRSAKCALQMLRFHLLGVELDQMTWGRRVTEA